MPAPPYDAVLLVSFGGPEGPADVLPFLENVTRGRGVPRERLIEVSRHYAMFGGVSPINAQNRALQVALGKAVDLPVYWGNRNWAPYLVDQIATMRDDGIERALAFVTSAYSSYSGCRQYREDIERARLQVGDGAPVVDKIRVFYHHPGFVLPYAAAIRAALAQFTADERAGARLLFTAHSIPVTMAESSAYEPQLRETCRQVVRAVGGELAWSLAWNSRSGPTEVPWLAPDISEALEQLARQGVPGIVVVPVGFVSDHLEVVYDLDTVAIPAARATGMAVVRAATPGLDLVPMVASLVAERTVAGPSWWLGSRGRSHDGCPRDCCPPQAAPPISRGAR